METVLFGFFFFRAPAPAKFKLRKWKMENGKVWSWYKTNERGKLVCLEKALFLISAKDLAVNQKAWPTFFSDCVCLLFVRTAIDCKL